MARMSAMSLVLRAKVSEDVFLVVRETVLTDVPFMNTND